MRCLKNLWGGSAVTVSVFFVSAALIFILSSASPVWADSNGISGSVKDESGQPLANVDLELLTTNGHMVAHTTTDPQGQYTITPAQAGTYTLSIEKAGFEPTTQVIVYPPIDHKPLSVVIAPEELKPVIVKAGQTGGPGVSSTGASDYAVTTEDISNLPLGDNTKITDVLAQMPGVAIDQNQQIHIRNNEGPQFQYQINGILVPLDINTNPPFISMINPKFVNQMDLIDGILPSRYSYATGGVVDIQTKDGCSEPGGSLSLLAGQRNTIQPSVQYSGCNGKLSYFVSGLVSQSNTAFSSATPGANPVHDWTDQGQGFGFFSYEIDATTKISLLTSTAASNNQLPNVPGLTPQFNLAGVDNYPSQGINSYLNFRDSLVMFALNGSPNQNLTYQLAYSVHHISQDYVPDNTGELIYQGVASTSSHTDLDNTIEGDLTYKLGNQTLGTGFYLGEYRVVVDDSSLVFPVDDNGNQTSAIPIQVINNTSATNIVSGVYVNDLIQINERLKANVGLRWDGLTGFTSNNQIDPTINLSYMISPDTTLHGGFARYMQVPSFQGISPTAPAAFAETTAEGPPGISTPLTEDDYEVDIGAAHNLTPKLTISFDNYYEKTHHYLDTGQFGVVPIFAPFNYDHGYIWGSELAAKYKGDNLSAYGNITYGRNQQTGVATGQFNFDPDELAFIDSHNIDLDHQPLLGASAGVTYDWKPYSFGVETIYSDGLRGGFADQEQLPTVVQVDASIERTFQTSKTGQLIDRLSFLNIFDRINLIRPAEGIGIFQSAYGPRFTIYNTLTIPF